MRSETLFQLVLGLRIDEFAGSEGSATTAQITIDYDEQSPLFQAYE